jgi:hypothetical protein
MRNTNLELLSSIRETKLKIKKLAEDIYDSLVLPDDSFCVEIEPSCHILTISVLKVALKDVGFRKGFVKKFVFESSGMLKFNVKCSGGDNTKKSLEIETAADAILSFELGAESYEFSSGMKKHLVYVNMTKMAAERSKISSERWKFTFKKTETGYRIFKLTL